MQLVQVQPLLKICWLHLQHRRSAKESKSASCLTALFMSSTGAGAATVLHLLASPAANDHVNMHAQRNQCRRMCCAQADGIAGLGIGMEVSECSESHVLLLQCGWWCLLAHTHTPTQRMATICLLGGMTQTCHRPTFISHLPRDTSLLLAALLPAHQLLRQHHFHHCCHHQLLLLLLCCAA
jgi:hypothetical protein